MFNGIPVKQGNERYFKFKIEEAGCIAALAFFKFNKGDVNLTLFDSSEKELATAKEKTTDELLIHEVQAGEYYLKVENITKGLTNDISLLLKFGKLNEQKSFVYAQKLDVVVPEDISQSALFEKDISFNSEKWYYFSLTRRRRLQFSIKQDKPAGTKFYLELCFTYTLQLSM